MVKTMDEKVIFRMPGDELSAFRRRVTAEGLSISIVLRRSIADYMKLPVSNAASRKLDIPFAGCLKDAESTADYRSRAADYVLERCR